MIRHAGWTAAIYTYRTPRSPYLTVVHPENLPQSTKLWHPPTPHQRFCRIRCRRKRESIHEFYLSNLRQGHDLFTSMNHYQPIPFIEAEKSEIKRRLSDWI